MTTTESAIAGDEEISTSPEAIRPIEQTQLVVTMRCGIRNVAKRGKATRQTGTMSHIGEAG
jgi:hypothetical protein